MKTRWVAIKPIQWGFPSLAQTSAGGLGSGERSDQFGRGVIGSLVMGGGGRGGPVKK